MLLVGLTGNYGMGKSRVLEAFARLGARTISADEVVRELLEDRAVLARVREALGPVVFCPDGSLDKARAARLIFMDAHRRRALEDVLHPLVFERIEEALEGEEAKVAVVEVPLLFERGHAGRFHRTVAVYADFTTVLKRLRERGILRDDILLRHAAQMPASDKIRRADHAIDNNGTFEETERQVKALYEKFLAESGNHGPARA